MIDHTGPAPGRAGPRWAAAVALAVWAGGRPAAAHVQPSLNENNRYLKLTPLGDRARLAYTIYYGEVPGAALRRQLDADRDGQVSDAEAAVLGAELGTEVRQRLTVTLDGADVPVAWSDVDVGLGTPDTAAGSFAVDLVATFCWSRGAHELVLRDDYPLAIPGETELKVETGLGVTVERIAIGGSAVVGDDVRLRGTGGPLAEDGWAVKVVIGPAAPAGGAACGAAAPIRRTPRSRRWIAIAVAGLTVIGGAAVVLLRRRRRRR